MSTFNADAFMNTEVEGVGETDYTPIPEGEYQAAVKEIKAGATDNGNAFLEIYWMIDSAEVRDLLGQDEPTARQTLWLDINDQGGLAFGANKNIQLFRLRAALGQNDGKPWKPDMMMGQVATVNIKHRLVNNAPFAEVKGVRS